MPTVDLLLPPHTYSPWRPARPTTANHRVVAAFSLLALWIERVRQRQALATLDDHMLRDIGITRVDVARECDKPFWR